MTKIIGRSFIVLSAEHSTDSNRVNSEATEQLRLTLKGYTEDRDYCPIVREAIGMWHGTSERSFAVEFVGDADYQYLRYLAFIDHKQDYVLHVDSNRKVYFETETAVIDLGWWREVAAERVSGYEGNTNIDGRYYVAKGF
jgi:hypothetical protein